MSKEKATRLERGPLTIEYYDAAASLWGRSRQAYTAETIHTAWEEFCDYWCALPPNSKATKTDWLATWRNKIRSNIQRAEQRHQQYAPRQSITHGLGSSAAARAGAGHGTGGGGRAVGPYESHLRRPALDR